MGQKIHPLVFRLGATQSHYSIWFAKPKMYFENVKEDKIIRYCINNFIQKTVPESCEFETDISGYGMGRIKIQKRIDLIKVIIYMGLPNSLKEKVKDLRVEQLKTQVQKKVTCGNRELDLEITKLPSPYLYRDAKIVAEFLSELLRNRISFRKAMQKVIELAEQADTKGVQIKIAGRMEGKEIARVEWTREGRVPLQTIRAPMDFCSVPLITLFGVFGVKIWIFQNF
ncbi:unnamed protein product [Lathyrus sativus]|nr:unnamed protein product [Lathyrus sativus]